MSAVIEAREAYKDLFAKKHGIKLGFMSFFSKAACLALKDVPAANAYLDAMIRSLHEEAMLLSRLAMALYFAAPDRQQEALERRARLSAEALAMARRLGEDSVLAPVLYARCSPPWDRTTWRNGRRSSPSSCAWPKHWVPRS